MSGRHRTTGVAAPIETTFEGRTVFVTGATGFLGRALVSRLLADGANVRALARSEDRAGRLPDAVPVHLGDVTDPTTLAEPIAGVDVLFHLAAALGGDFEHQRQVNTEGTKNVAEAAATADVGRVVHVSTLAVYGFAGTDFPETRPPSPSAQAYSTTKAGAEEALRRVATETDLEHTIIRPTLIFGPGAWLWTARFFRRAARKGAIFPGRGEGTLPVIHVDDVVDLMVTQAIHPAAAGEAFNCNIDPSPTLRQYHQAYGALIDRDGWLGIPMPLAKGAAWIAGRFADSRSYLRFLPEIFDWLERTKSYPTDKAAQLLGWSPVFDVDSGVAACVPWLKEKGLLSP